MKKVQLNDLPLQVLAGQEALEVEHEGKLLGYFYPVRQRDTAADDELWDRLDEALDRAAAESGMSRDELIDALDPRKPFPFETAVASK
ncbi:MAG TPA: hypothetical protein IGS52_18275 [Oscillatoriaceae cyanobacterium M33_DOE_052]|uniref:Uncharacterized protein n=1 Tax=Planktothricoides sp. SpSt-374 TaxID=2282167 RepID=A0A7C3VFV5_9CYAN|nr:hypothetical protein [Oscillatoriaceae cyanobacterium M33_DOE_052]